MTTKKIAFIVTSLFLIACSKQNVEEENVFDNDLKTINYVYQNKTIAITARLNTDTDFLEPIHNKALGYLAKIYEENTNLMEVYGLTKSSDIYLFKNESDHIEYLKSNNRQDLLKYYNNSSEKSSINQPLYTNQNLRLFLDSYLNKELDWTSNCYYYTGFGANQNRMKNFNRFDTNYWRYRNSNISCYPSGIGNANDKLSSFSASPAVSVVTIYKHANFRGRSKKFYRRDAGIVAGDGYFYINNQDRWMWVIRLKSYSLGWFGNWDDDVSSIRLD